jgi:DNA-binding NarL/FixJ family response regulator
VASYSDGVPEVERRILVVEDDQLMASLLAQVLDGHGFDVETAADVINARAIIRTFDPDAVLLDISLGDGPTGLDLAYALSQQRPDIAIIFLTKHSDLRTAGVEEADIPAGSGFLRKDRVRDSEYLLESIEAVLTDRPRDVRHDMEPGKPFGGLDDKHLVILRLMAMGYTNDYIAKLKGVGQSTVERWTKEIFETLGIETKGHLNPRVEAVRQFITLAGTPERT